MRPFVCTGEVAIVPASPKELFAVLCDMKQVVKWHPRFIAAEMTERIQGDLLAVWRLTWQSLTSFAKNRGLHVLRVVKRADDDGCLIVIRSIAENARGDVSTGGAGGGAMLSSGSPTGDVLTPSGNSSGGSSGDRTKATVMTSGFCVRAARGNPNASCVEYICQVYGGLFPVPLPR